MKSPSNAFFTIIIPTLNEEKDLPNLLQDLTNQSWKNFKVIIVDGNSVDKTTKVAESFKNKLTLQIIQSKKRHVSIQRNLGAKQATTPWLIFIDADTRLPSYFLFGIRYQLLKNLQTDLFTCHMSLGDYEGLDKLSIQIINQVSKTAFKITPGGMGAMIGARRKVFQSGIKFDENLSYGEDGSFLRAAALEDFNYQYFEDPTYVYNLRRLKKEGHFRMLLIFMMGFLHKEGEFKKYPMGGGGYYQQKRETLVNKIKQFLDEQKKQISSGEMRQLLEEFKDLFSNGKKTN